jgi:hypothetical protein
VRFLPASLLWRTLLVLLTALGAVAGAAVWLLDEYVTRPRNAA